MECPLAAKDNLTPRSKKVMEIARAEARQLGRDYVGTEHILLGILREGDGIAADVLRAEGVNFDTLRSAILRAIQERSEATPGGVFRWRPQPALTRDEMDALKREIIDAILRSIMDSLKAA